VLGLSLVFQAAVVQ